MVTVPRTGKYQWCRWRLRPFVKSRGSPLPTVSTVSVATATSSAYRIGSTSGRSLPRTILGREGCCHACHDVGGGVRWVVAAPDPPYQSLQIGSQQQTFSSPMILFAN